MSPQLYAALNDQGTVVAVFSSEDLAQTHAAKLRIASDYGSKASVERLLFPVKALITDAEVQAEVVYRAAIERKIEKVHKPFKATQLDLNRVGLGETLPRDDWEGFTHGVKKNSPQTLQRWLSFEAFGWSPEHAITKLEALVANYLRRVAA